MNHNPVADKGFLFNSNGIFCRGLNQGEVQYSRPFLNANRLAVSPENHHGPDAHPFFNDDSANNARRKVNKCIRMD